MTEIQIDILVTTIVFFAVLGFVYGLGMLFWAARDSYK